LNKFPKSERLHSKKQIEQLFSQGDSFTVYPLKVVYLKKPFEPRLQNQVLVSTPKKNFKRSVDRNKLKRRIKEAYRLHKQVLENKQAGFYLLIGYIYVGKEISSYQIIEEKLKQSLERLKEIIG
jgi:ribonuclease P protein component